MKIETLEELEALVQMCHRQNVHAMKIDGLEFALAPISADPKQESKALDPFAALQEPSEEELLYWSSSGPGDNSR